MPALHGLGDEWFSSLSCRSKRSGSATTAGCVGKMILRQTPATAPDGRGVRAPACGSARPRGELDTFMRVAAECHRRQYSGPVLVLIGNLTRTPKSETDTRWPFQGAYTFRLRGAPKCRSDATAAGVWFSASRRKPSSCKLFPAGNPQTGCNQSSGMTPELARGTRTLPIPVSIFGFNRPKPPCHSNDLPRA